MHILHLNKPETWEWRQSPCKALTPPVEVLSVTLDDGWQTCSQMKRGSAIQVELLAAGLIPDPFLGRNEEVSTPPRLPRLFTFAESRLHSWYNGSEKRTGSIGPPSMFRSYRVAERWPSSSSKDLTHSQRSIVSERAVETTTTRR